jgi:8-oxo-dGTP diphosphatase
MDGTRVGIAVVVTSADGRILLAERRGDGRGELAVPGGRLDPGETVEECAVRELREETGIAIDAADVTTFAATLVDGWVVVGVAARLDTPAAEVLLIETEPDKVGSFVWAEPGALPGTVYPATAAILALAPPQG